jgi:hypothetical protein
MYRFRLTLALAALSLLSASSPIYALANVAPEVYLIESDDGIYAAGTRAMNEQRWPDAIREFDKVIAAKDGRRVEAALYWKAYSLRKMSRLTEAAATCDLLRAQFSSSSWNRDCKAMSIEVRVDARDIDRLNVPVVITSHGEGKTPGDPDAELKLLALNSLSNQDPARAMPILRGILTGNQSDEMKKQAIFVLTQSRSPEAALILHDVVVGKLGTPLQRQAIPMMGVFQGKRSNDTLMEVYRMTNDGQVKRAVISALFISHDAPRMVELARGEKDMEIKRSIVSQLAVMNDKAATDYMLELLK